MRYIYRVPSHDHRDYYTWHKAGKWTKAEVDAINERAHARWLRISRLVG